MSENATVLQSMSYQKTQTHNYATLSVNAPKELQNWVVINSFVSTNKASKQEDSQAMKQFSPNLSIYQCVS